ncbi:MAG: tyrosine-type recombinase/integrase [Butyrivibrio sp.]|nr:tyrosine-type recombinase/integrase [Butyrivibrio sp.]
MIISDQTIDYKDKIEAAYNARISALLNMMPSYCASYEKAIQSKNKIKTRMEYLQDIHNFFMFIISTNPNIESAKDITATYLENLKEEDFENYLEWLTYYKFNEKNEAEKHKRNSAASKKRKLMALRSLFNYLYSNKITALNPAINIEVPKIKAKKDSEYFTLNPAGRIKILETIESQYKNAINTLEGKDKEKRSSREIKKPYLILRDRAIVYLFLGTGLRVSELCALNCADILLSDKNNIIIKTTDDKTKSPTSLCPESETVDALLYYLNYARDYLEPDSDNFDALFISSRHKRITPRAVELMIKSYANKALGINNNINPKTLRATYNLENQPCPQ